MEGQIPVGESTGFSALSFSPQRKQARLAKCHFCRSAKQKCQPIERRWPNEKCERCLERGLQCSEGQLPRRYNPPVESTGISFGPQDSGSTLAPRYGIQKVSHDPSLQPANVWINGEEDHRIIRKPIGGIKTFEITREVLLLESIREILMMALRELKLVSDSMTRRFRDDPFFKDDSECLPRSDRVFHGVKHFASTLEERIRKMMGNGDLMMLVDALYSIRQDYTSSDVSWPVEQSELNHLQERMNFYESQGHYGIVYVLCLKKFSKDSSISTGSNEVIRLIHVRETFLKDAHKLLREQGLLQYAPKNFQQSQIFIPCKLVGIPEILAHVTSINAPDCLGRTVWHLESDAGKTPRWPDEYINFPDSLGRTALGLACYQARNLAHVNDLLLRKADPYALDCYGMSPANIAASMGDMDIFQSLMASKQRSGNSISSVQFETFGRTPLQWASLFGRTGMVMFLCAWQDKENDYQDNFGCTALTLAAYRGHEQTVQELIQNGASVHITDKKGRTPFWYAAQHAHVGIMKVIASHHANVDHRDNDGVTPLAIAAESGSVETLRFFFPESVSTVQSIYKNYKRNRFNVDVDSKDNQGKSVLGRATQAKRFQCVEILLKHLASPGLISNAHRYGFNCEYILGLINITKANNDLDTLNLFAQYFPITFVDLRAYLNGARLSR